MLYGQVLVHQQDESRISALNDEALLSSEELTRVRAQVAAQESKLESLTKIQTSLDEEKSVLQDELDAVRKSAESAACESRASIDELQARVSSLLDQLKEVYPQLLLQRFVFVLSCVITKWIRYRTLNGCMTYHLL